MTTSPGPAPEAAPLVAGDERVVLAGAIAHGGHVVAHSDGRTLFVRHALPGETVRVRVTEVNRRIVRADAIEVLEPSPDRVAAPCPWARAGGCGGCDFQHVALPAQRELKQAVVTEALVRFGRLGEAVDRLDLAVEALPGPADGLRWRTRMRWGVRADRALGLRGHRSHRIVPVGTCLLAAPGTDAADLGPAAPGADEVVAARGSDGVVAVGGGRVREQVGGREWRVAASSFWQVHPALAGRLQELVLDFGGPRPGEQWWDLYSGAGLLSAPVAEAVGPDGLVEAVELSREGSREARRALHDLPQVRLHQQDVVAWLSGRAGSQAPAGVVLDPPRAGAGAAVVTALADLHVPVIVYVACDPVALGRDVALLAERGYRLDAVRALDAFPMTHHVETVARLVRGES